jgi:uncharacterized LabA/DUF88 family protein
VAKLAIFVDGAHVDFLLRDEFGRAHIDYAQFAEAIRAEIDAKCAEPVDLLRTYYYHCLPHQGNPPTLEESERYGRMRRFTDALDKLPRFKFRQGRLAPRGFDAAGVPQFVQKRIDLMLGIDLALLSGKQKISHAALVGGDSDFMPAIEAGQAEGVSMWLIHGPSTSHDGRPTYHRDLWNLADERFELSQPFIDKLKVAPKPSSVS